MKNKSYALLLALVLCIGTVVASLAQYIPPGTGSGTQSVNIQKVLGSTMSAANPVNVLTSVAGAVISATNGSFTNLLQGNAVLSATNGVFANLLQGNAVISATNGLYNNLLQGNAVISATNGLFSNILQGNAVLSPSNPIFNAQGSVAIANTTNVTADLVATTSTVVSAFTAARNLSVINGDPTAVIYVDLKSGTASNTNGLRLGPGQGHTWAGLAGTLTTFSYYSTAAGTKTLSYSAW